MTFFILTFKGSSGNPAYLCDPAVFGEPRTYTNPWMRAEHRASVFTSVRAAFAARDALVDARRYEAPECNAGLERRLNGAIVVPVTIEEIGTVQIRNGREVAVIG